MPGAVRGLDRRAAQRRVQAPRGDLDLGQLGHALASRLRAVRSRAMAQSGSRSSAATPAGMSAASIARRRDPDLEIVAFERGPYTSYSACGIPYYVGGARRGRRPADQPQPGGAPRARHRRAHAAARSSAIDLARARLTVRARRGERVRGAVRPARRRDRRRGGARRRSRAPRRSSRRARSTRPSACARRSSAAASARSSSARATSASRWPRRSSTRGLRVTMIEQAPQVMAHARRRHGRARAGRRRGARHPRRARRARSRRSCSTTTARRSRCAPADETFAADHVVLGDGREAGRRRSPRRRACEVGDSGALRVDDHQRCPGHDGVFAAGDCVES